MKILSPLIMKVKRGYPNHTVTWEVKRLEHPALVITVHNVQRVDKDGIRNLFVDMGYYSDDWKLKIFSYYLGKNHMIAQASRLETMEL